MAVKMNNWSQNNSRQYVSVLAGMILTVWQGQQRRGWNYWRNVQSLFHCEHALTDQ